jgi:Tfp pilus assembly protein PilO
MNLKAEKTKKKKKSNILAKNFGFALFLSYLIIGVVFYIFIFSPLMEKRSLYNSSVLETKKSELLNKEKLLKELKQANDIYQKITPELKNKMFQILPQAPDLPELYSDLEILAKQSGFELKSVSAVILENKKKDNVVNKLNSPVPVEFEIQNLKTTKEIKISLVINGSGYTQFKQFLDLIEHNIRILDIESYTYSPEDTSHSLVLRTYFYE